MSNDERKAPEYACDVAKLDTRLAEIGCKRVAVAVTDFEGECGVMVAQQLYKIMTGEGYGFSRHILIVTHR